MKITEILYKPAVKKLLVVLVALTIVSVSTSVVYINLSNDENKEVKNAFAQRTERVQEELDREVIRYQNLVATVGAFFNASEDVSKVEFDQFVKGMGIESSFPGVQGLAFAQRIDGSEAALAEKQARELGVEFSKPLSTAQGEHATLLYVQPANEQAPPGFDTYSVPGGKEGLTKAAEQSTVVASSPLQYTINGEDVTGFVLAYPVANGTPLDLPSNAGFAYPGWVFAFVNLESILPSLNSLKDMNISIVDMATSANVVASKDSQESKYKSTFEFTIGTRDHRVVLTPKNEFISQSFDSSKATRSAIIIANVQIVAMLIMLVFYMHKTRRKREVNLTFQAGHDQLTGLPNRFYLEKWLQERSTSNARRQQKVAVLFIDLDGFKAINDTLGHQMGDEFLIAISQRLQKEVRGQDLLARLGGDEFIVVLDEVSDEIQATRIAQRLIEVVRFPVMLDSGPVCVSASIGIAITQIDSNSDATSVIRFADAAMYAAKEDKHERIRIFDHKLKSIVDGRHEVESSIRGAAARSEIVDMLQPLIDVSTGNTFGYEALCRWSHPIFGILSPDQFLDAAKVTGEIIEIDRWMVNKAFKTAIDISKTSNRETRVWVNLSVRHLLQGEFYQHVMKALRNSDTTADMLGVEIEEEVFKIDNGLLYPFLNQLRDLGIAIALDDFGSEDASLQALKRYPYDVIKLDRSLTTEFASNPSTSIVPAVVELAKSEGMTVVATGVETPDQLQAIIDVGCDVVQGYVFSEPKPFEDLVDRREGFRWQLPLGVRRKSTEPEVFEQDLDSTDAQQAN